MNAYGLLKQRVYDLLALPTHHQEFEIKKFLAEAYKNSLYSPDIIQLEQHRRQLIFVHDDMRRGGSLHSYITETSVTGRWPTHGAFTQDEFFYWKKDLGADSYPVALDRDVSGHYFGDKQEPAKIHGEVFAIRPYQFRKLDMLRENGLQFIRRRVKLIIPRYKVIYDKAHPLPGLREANGFLEAWMYVGNLEYWDDQLAGVIPSSPVPIIEDHARAWLKKYYQHKNDPI